MKSFAPVGVTLRTDFLHTTASLLQSAFTISVFKDGVGVANTGVTITYVSGLQYTVTIDGSTGFVNAPGTYVLVISLTANTNYSWSETWSVTSDVYKVQGGFLAPIAVFTAANGNGRVTDGSSPIQGTVVTVRRPNSSILSQFITDVNGLIGTIVFDTTGTHAITVEANSFAAGYSSVSVSGSTVTGPGADIVLTAVASVGTLAASSLWTYARRMYKDHIGAKADAEIKDAVNEALWMVASVKDWQWYQTIGTITLKAQYTTDTATLTQDSAVVTFAGALPAWVDETCDIQCPDGQWYPILTRDSNTQLTLTAVWPIASQTAQLIVAKSKYALPADCRNIEKILTFDTWLWGNMPVSPASIEMAKRRIQTFNPCWSVERGNLIAWPMSNVDKTAVYLYWRRPVALTTSTDLADIDEKYLELLNRAIDFQIAARGDCVAGDRPTCLNAFKEALGRVAPNDTGPSSPETAPPAYGYNPFSAFYGKVN